MSINTPMIRTVEVIAAFIVSISINFFDPEIEDSEFTLYYQAFNSIRTIQNIIMCVVVKLLLLSTSASILFLVPVYYITYIK